jgi:hypothetical protein
MIDKPIPFVKNEALRMAPFPEEVAQHGNWLVDN